LQYRFWKRGVELAILAGVKFPTGRTNLKDRVGVKFETEQQPGSGSWDGDFGIAASRSFFKHLSVATSFQYTLRGYGAQNHKSGDVFRYNIGAAYALRRFGQYPNLSLIYELNHEWALRDRSREQKRVLDSGGTAVFGTPGVRAEFTKNISAFWGMPLPIYQNLGGEHEKLRYEIIAGVNIYL
jgi:hypothetical protein